MDVNNNNQPGYYPQLYNHLNNTHLGKGWRSGACSGNTYMKTILMDTSNNPGHNNGNMDNSNVASTKDKLASQYCRDKYLQRARRSILRRDLKNAKLFLKKAHSYDPNYDIDYVLKRIEAIEPTINANKYVKQAENDIKQEKYKKALKNLIKATSLDSNINISCLYHTATEAVLKEEVKLATDEAKEYIARKEYEKAEKCINNVEENELDVCYSKELRKKLEEAKRAGENSTNEEKKKVVQMYIEERDVCIDAAKQAIADKTFDKAKSFLKIVQMLDPLFDITDMLKVVEDAIKKKTEIDNLLKTTVNAIAAEDYQTAIDNINKVKSIDNTVITSDLYENVIKGIKQQVVTIWIQLTEKLISGKQFVEAEQCINEMEEKYLHKHSAMELRKKLEVARKATTPVIPTYVERKRYITAVSNCIAKGQFSKAEMFLSKVQVIDPKWNVSNLQKRIDVGRNLKKKTDKYMKKAKDAISNRNYQLALDNLYEIKCIDHQVNTSKLYRIAQEGLRLTTSGAQFYK